jgi:hypothetical protein
MPSLIRRILGGRDDDGTPSEWATWDGPWHVGCVAPRARCVHRARFVVDDPRAEHDREHYVLRGLTPLHLLDGGDSLIVSRELGDVLAGCCTGGLDVVRADVMDAATGRHLPGYAELRPRERITGDEVLRLKPRDARVWRYEAGRSHLFVSRPVMHAVRQRRILGLQFLPGLSGFLGRAEAR